MRSDSKNILITGATGFIGFNFTNYLVKKGFNVHLIVRRTSSLKDFNHLKTAFIHIYDGKPESLEKIFNANTINFVFHLATHYEKLEVFNTITNLNDVCINLTNQLFDVIIKQKNLIGFINIGTIWQTHQKFDNFYTMYKFFQEELVKFHSIKYDIKALSLLLTDTYGPNDWRPKLLNQLKDAIRNGYELKIINPNAKLNLIFIDDVCDALYLCMNLVMNQNANYSIYKIQADKSVLLNNLVNRLNSILDSKINVIYGEVKSTLDVGILGIVKLLPGWIAKVDLNTGLKRLFEDKE